MEILSNFSSAYCFISFILGAVFILTIHCIAAMGKVQEQCNNVQEPINKVHFYVARDKNGDVWLYIGKPFRGNFQSKFYPDKKGFCLTHNINRFGLKYEDYDSLKWEDEPVEVFINMEN